MNYVMVPVPEEFAHELSVAVMKMGLAKALATWDEAAVATTIADVDEATRELVVLVARTSLNDHAIHLDDAARTLGRTPHEVLELKDRANAVGGAQGKPDLVLWNPRPAVGDDGTSRPANLLAVGRDVASHVLSIVGEDPGEPA